MDNQEAHQVIASTSTHPAVSEQLPWPCLEPKGTGAPEQAHLGPPPVQTPPTAPGALFRLSLMALFLLYRKPTVLGFCCSSCCPNFLSDLSVGTPKLCFRYLCALWSFFLAGKDVLGSLVSRLVSCSCWWCSQEPWPAHHLSWPETLGGSGHCPRVACAPGSSAVFGSWVSMTRVSKDSVEVFCVRLFLRGGVKHVTRFCFLKGREKSVSC